MNTVAARYRDLLLSFAGKEIRVRYKQSVMGFMWALLMPLLVVSAGAVVRAAIAIASGASGGLSVSLVPSLVPVLVKSAPWAFFVSGLRFGTDSLVRNGNLVTKIYFPREVIPYSAVLAALFDFGIASSLVVVGLTLVRVGVSVYLAWVPLILVLLILFTAGLALLLSCANLFFRDVKYIVEAFLTYGVFFTPVFYEARMFGEWAPILLLNPVGALLEALNDVIVRHQPPDPSWLIYAASWSVGTLVVSHAIFRATAPRFAEKV